MTTLPNTHLIDHLSLLGGRCQLLFSDIVFVEAQGSYAIFHCDNGEQIMTSKSLSWYQSRLPDYFIRVHKSYFVSLDCIVAFEKEAVHLSNGKCITVSRRRRRVVRKLIKTRLVTPLSFPTSLSV